jgi:hypothetical protein
LGVNQLPGFRSQLIRFASLYGSGFKQSAQVKSASNWKLFETSCPFNSPEMAAINSDSPPLFIHVSWSGNASSFHRNCLSVVL